MCLTLNMDYTLSICLQCRRPRFNLWDRKIPWRIKWQPTPVLLPGKFPWTEEPGRLQSIGLQRVGHNWVTEHTHIQIIPDQAPLFSLHVPLSPGILSFWHKMFQSYSDLELSISPQEVLVPFLWGKVFRSQVLAIRVLITTGTQFLLMLPIQI